MSCASKSVTWLCQTPKHAAGCKEPKEEDAQERCRAGHRSRDGTDFDVFLSGSWFGTMEFYIFPYLGNGKISPSDEVHHFSEGWVYQPPTS